MTGEKLARFSNRDRRALRVGLLLAAPALFYSRAVKPYVASIRQLSAHLERQTNALRHERSVVAESQSFAQRIAVERAVAASVRQHTYSQHDAIAATSALSRDISRVFENAGATLQRFETREPVLRKDRLRELAVDVRVEGDFAAILTAMASLDANPRLMRVTRMAIDGGSTTTVQNVANETGTPILSFVATIRGYAF